MKAIFCTLLFYLVKGETLFSSVNCSQEIAWIFQNITDLNIKPYLSSDKFQYSGHFLNNLGEYDACEDDPRLKYSLLRISIPGVPILMQGICTVKTCDSEELNKVISKRKVIRKK